MKFDYEFLVSSFLNFDEGFFSLFIIHYWYSRIFVVKKQIYGFYTVRSMAMQIRWGISKFSLSEVQHQPYLFLDAFYSVLGHDEDVG